MGPRLRAAVILPAGLALVEVRAGAARLRFVPMWPEPGAGR